MSTPTLEQPTQTDYLAGLNPDQQVAVATTEGPVLIVAGPGSGKTRVLIHRIGRLVDEKEINPQSILAVTFTNKAANEMKTRLSTMIAPARAASVHMSTFHRWCVRVLRQRGPDIGLDRAFTIYDSDDSRVAIERAMELARVEKSQFKPRTIQAEISSAKSRLMDPMDYREASYQYRGENEILVEKTALVYPIYQRLIENTTALDFDDLIRKAVLLFEQVDDTRAYYHRRYRYVMVDEFQDTNLAQYRLMQLVVGPHHNVCVVGDPDQSIYGWRNADIGNILNFQQHYPDVQVVNLGHNYRSTVNIIQGAGWLIENNSRRIPNPLRTHNPAGDPIMAAMGEGPEDEADIIFDWLTETVRDTDLSWADCAVAYRTNAQSRALEEECVRREIPYRLLGGVRFYDRREIRDVLGYLKALLNPADDVSVQRVINLPPRRIGGTTVQRMTDFSEHVGNTLLQTVRAVQSNNPLMEIPAGLNKPAVAAVGRFGALMESLDQTFRERSMVELIDQVLETSGLGDHIRKGEDGDDRWNNVLELRSEAEKFEGVASEGALAEFLEHVALVANVDEYDPDVGAVSLITLHQSKGLEFGAVVMAGLEDGLLPLARSDDVEEERRLCYVGMTRAKQRLLLTWADYRRGMEQYRSRFLDEIPNVVYLSSQSNSNSAN